MACLALSPVSMMVQGSPTPSRHYRSHVDLLHLHHGVESALRLGAACSDGLGQHARRDLPVDAPPVLAPAAGAFLAAIADDGVPAAIGFLLGLGCNLEREC